MGKMIDRSVLGGAAIAFCAVLANMVNNAYVSPIVFAVGIMMCIQFRLNLITKAVPTGESIKNCIVIYVVNVIMAAVIGFIFKSRMNIPSLNCDMFEAIMTGIIIGCVAMANKHKGQYDVIITLVLMWAFVFLKLPHCVVYAMWMGAGYAGIKQLLIVTIGNIIGGITVLCADKMIER